MTRGSWVSRIQPVGTMEGLFIVNKADVCLLLLSASFRALRTSELNLYWLMQCSEWSKMTLRERDEEDGGEGEEVQWWRRKEKHDGKFVKNRTHSMSIFLDLFWSLYICQVEGWVWRSDKWTARKTGPQINIGVRGENQSLPLHMWVNVLDHGASVSKPRGEFSCVEMQPPHTFLSKFSDWRRQCSSVLQNSSGRGGWGGASQEEAQYPALPFLILPVTPFIQGLFSPPCYYLIHPLAPFHHLRPMCRPDDIS